MGCAASSHGDALLEDDLEAQTKACRALGIRHTVINAAVLGKNKQKARMQRAFAKGTDTVFLITVPGPHKKVRWVLLNDSECEVKVNATFFQADDLDVLCEDDATVDWTDDTLKLELAIAPLETVAFVEGNISGFMWSCFFISPRGETFIAFAEPMGK